MTPGHVVKRYFLRHVQLQDDKRWRLLRPLLRRPQSLRFTRRAVTGAVAIGLFFAWVPVPFQMVFAGLAAMVAKVNIPISALMVWITNPITMPPMFYFAYKVGAWALDEVAAIPPFVLSFEWLWSSSASIWQPFLLGCFITGVFTAVLGSFTLHAIWRYWVLLERNRRQRHGTTS